MAGLRQTIDRLDLGRHATITGIIDDAHLDALYRRADAYVQPAENSGGAFEGFGLTILRRTPTASRSSGRWTAAPRTPSQTARTAIWCRSATRPPSPKLSCACWTIPALRAPWVSVAGPEPSAATGATS